MKKALRIIVTVLGILGCAGAGLAQANLSTEEIVNRSNYMALYQGQDFRGTVSLTIIDKQGRMRERQFNMLRMNMDGNDLDQKHYVYFLEPADVRKMVFMVHKHVGQDDDRWMYLPSLDLVKRIAASDKRTSFVGSDFLYEDISGRSPEEDTHELLETTNEHYVIKNVPVDSDGVEFAYYIATIDKQTFLPAKIEYHKSDDRLYRVIETLSVESVSATENGTPTTYPTVIRSVARDLENESSTEMVLSNTQYNLGLKEDIFTERYLRMAPKEVMP
ncbi:MAG: outer membrane lipoprotein-sorting protein [Desulfovibrionaceae bacterium]